MSAFRKFDPYAVILESDGAPPKVAKVAKVVSANPKVDLTLGALGALGGLGANIANPTCSLPAAHPQKKADRLSHNPFSAAPRTPMNVPADWVAGLERLNGMTCPIAVGAKRWLQLKMDARCFVDQWGGQAAALGWSTLDVFGCHPTRPADHYDTMGLVWMIADAEVVAMGAEVANLRKAAGTLQRVWKCPIAHGRILAWDL
jgi:hypothetical protein